jgi:17beta-estradiol 17-dehydrogenase / very-long-chain 3-oxoacyl-CoA reductase
MPTLWLATLAGIGLLTLLYILTSLYHFLTLHLLLPSHPLSSYKRPGSEPTYALITGASAGIGLGIAQALVKRGFGVILLGHLEDEYVFTFKFNFGREDAIS